MGASHVSLTAIRLEHEKLTALANVHMERAVVSKDYSTAGVQAEPIQRNWEQNR